MKKQYTVLILIVILGLLLRIKNDTEHKLYPDYYQNTLVAKNIKENGLVTGYLGEGGMFFPPLVGWARPVYPLLINIFDQVTHNTETSTKVISIGFSTLSIILAFLVVSTLTKHYFKQRDEVQLCTVCLTTLVFAISFSQAVWPGFRLTEPIGIFMLLLYMYFVFSLAVNETKESLAQYFNDKDLFLGFVFSILTFTRFEYVLLIIPTIIFWKLENKLSIPKLVSFIISFSLTSAVFLVLLFPWESMLTTLVTQNLKIIVALTIFTIVGIFLIFREETLFNKLIMEFLKYSRFSYLWIVVCFLVWFLAPSVNISNYVSTIARFFIYDPLIGCLSLYGIYKTKEKSHNLTVFAILSAVLLYIVYFLINPTMLRYSAHLVPFLLIPLVVGIQNINIKKLNSMSAILAMTLILQLFLTFSGTNLWSLGENKNELKHKSYKEISAIELKKYIDQDIQNKDNLMLITSTPEAYYYHTGIPTHSVSNIEPYIYLDHLPEGTEILIVEDAGMHIYFNEFLEKFKKSGLASLSNYSYNNPSVFYYGNQTTHEHETVNVYRLTLKDLKNSLSENHQ